MANTVKQILSKWQLDGFEGRVIDAFNKASIKDIAAKIGLNYHTFNNFLKLKRDFPPEFLIGLSRLSNCSIHWLLTQEGPKDIRDVNELSIEDLLAQVITQLNDLPNADRHYMALKIINEITQNSERIREREQFGRLRLDGQEDEPQVEVSDVDSNIMDETPEQQQRRLSRTQLATKSISSEGKGNAKRQRKRAKSS